MKKNVIILSSLIILVASLLVVIFSHDSNDNIVSNVDDDILDEIVINVKPTTSISSSSITTYVAPTPTIKSTLSSTSSIPSFIVGEKGVSSNVLKSVYNHFMNVPLNVRKSFIKDGWKIVIVANNLNKRFGYTSSILGLTVYKDKTIYIDNRSKAATSVEHEIGHYVNYKYDWIDTSNEFRNIYAEERKDFIKFTGSIAANTSTTIEYYAEAYQEYLWHPNKLKKYCPRTYEFINRNSNNL